MPPALPLDQLSSMPQVGSAFAGWTKPFVLKRITQSVVDGFVTEAESNFSFDGTIQPLSPNKINQKPEGQRGFEWLQIHCLTGAQNLTTNDRIFYKEKRYKIMATNDYSLNGYIEYHAIEDFQP